MSDMTKQATLIMLADEAFSRLRDMQKQAAEAKPVEVPKERAAVVADLLVKSAHIREDQKPAVAQALADHEIALDFVEKLAAHTVPASQSMGQEVQTLTPAQSALRRRGHDDTDAGRRFAAAFAR